MVRKWHQHGWRVKCKEVGHRDMWEHIWQLRQDAGTFWWCSASPCADLFAALATVSPRRL